MNPEARPSHGLVEVRRSRSSAFGRRYVTVPDPSKRIVARPRPTRPPNDFQWEAAGRMDKTSHPALLETKTLRADRPVAVKGNSPTRCS